MKWYEMSWCAGAFCQLHPELYILLSRLSLGILGFAVDPEQTFQSFKVSGTLMTYSLGGGTGSGLGSRLLEELRDLYPKIPLLATWPCKGLIVHIAYCMHIAISCNILHIYCIYIAIYCIYIYIYCNIYCIYTLNSASPHVPSVILHISHGRITIRVSSRSLRFFPSPAARIPCSATTWSLLYLGYKIWQMLLCSMKMMRWWPLQNMKMMQKNMKKPHWHRWTAS